MERKPIKWKINHTKKYFPPFDLGDRGATRKIKISINFGGEIF